MVPDDDVPLRLRGGERLVDPAELGERLGTVGRRVLPRDAVVAEPVDRERVEEEEAHARRVIDLLDAGVVGLRQIPARVEVVVSDLRLDVAFVIVVAERDVPRYLERGIRVDAPEGSDPVGVVRARDAGGIEVVAGGRDEVGADHGGDAAHRGGYFVLVIVAHAPPVAEDEKFDRALVIGQRGRDLVALEERGERCGIGAQAASQQQHEAGEQNMSKNGDLLSEGRHGSAVGKLEEDPICNPETRRSFGPEPGITQA